MKKPNILVILTEDISNNIGCYNDENAFTPRLDGFAKDNIRFTYCSSVAPVCSAARTSLSLGMYGTTAGVGQHRTERPTPQHIRPFAHYLKEAGYVTAIGKTDFNFCWEIGEGYDIQLEHTVNDCTLLVDTIKSVYDHCEDKPFFILQTTAATHQSQYGWTEDAEIHRETMPRLKEEEYQCRDKIKVPGYHFDKLEAREIWAQYQEKMTTMDRMFGEVIDQLKKDGLYEDTVIFFAGDNGHGIPLGKTTAWDEGIHVPFLAHIPEKFSNQIPTKTDEKGNRICERLVDFVDFGPTFLSIAGVDIPEHLQGTPFLGDKRKPEDDFKFAFSQRVDESYENSRCIRFDKFHYICDFSLIKFKRPICYVIKSAPWFVRSQIEGAIENNISPFERRSYSKQMLRINEQLFNTKIDPLQLNNIATELETKETIDQIREKLKNKMLQIHDDAFMPESMYAGYELETGKTAYELLRDDSIYPLKRLFDIYFEGISGEIEKINNLIDDDCDVIRLWVAKYLFEHGKESFCEKLLNDKNETVKAYVAYRFAEIPEYYNESVKVLIDLIEKTKNIFILMFVADLVTGWKKELTKPVFEALCIRYWGNNKIIASGRIGSCLNSGLNMLSLRIGCPIPENLDNEKMDIPSLEETQKIINLMDL